MNKPWYFMPFIFVYKFVFFILLLPWNIIKYSPKAVVILSHFFYKYIIKNIAMGIKNLLLILFTGIKKISHFIYNGILYSSIGFYKFLHMLVQTIKQAILYIAKQITILCTHLIMALSYLLYQLLLFIKKAMIFFFHVIEKGMVLLYRAFVSLLKHFVLGIYTVFLTLLAILKSIGLHFILGIEATILSLFFFMKGWAIHIIYGIEAFFLFLWQSIVQIGKGLLHLGIFFLHGIWASLYKIKSIIYVSGLSFSFYLFKQKAYRKEAHLEKLEKNRLEKKRRKEQEELRKQQNLAKKEIIQTETEYKNENVVIEKKTLSQKIKGFFLSIVHAPKNFVLYIKNKWHNSTFLKANRNSKEIERQALLINFDGEDAVKSDKKVLYEYVAKNAEGKVVKDYFEAFSKVEVHSYLLSEGYEVYSIKTSPWITFLHGRASVNRVKIKTKDLIFFITQLSTYIKAGIPLAEALKILSRQYKKPAYKKIFSAIIYDLTMGEAFSTSLEKQGNAFPKLLINMIKTSEMTGELPEALDDMADYYTEADKTRKQMVTAMMYPSMVFLFASAVIVFILIWVIPQFVEIYESMDASKIPAFTIFIINVSDFLKKYLIWLLLGLAVFVIMMIYLYKNIKMVRSMMQWVAMHMPVFGKVIIYNEVTMFTKTFSSLLKHNVFITDSMEILNKITNNEIYKMLILDTITNIAHGDKISMAFKDHWAFPIPAYEMLVTGEKTGQLPDMMGKVSAYYQDMHAQSVTRIKTFIEPALIIFLTVMVGIIILAIVLPMFGMYSMIG